MNYQTLMKLTGLSKAAVYRRGWHEMAPANLVISLRAVAASNRRQAEKLIENAQRYEDLAATIDELTPATNGNNGNTA